MRITTALTDLRSNPQQEDLRSNPQQEEPEDADLPPSYAETVASAVEEPAVGDTVSSVAETAPVSKSGFNLNVNNIQLAAGAQLFINLP